MKLHFRIPDHVIRQLDKHVDGKRFRSRAQLITTILADWVYSGGIAERDGGIEILLNGELIWSSTEYIGTGETVRQSIYHDVDRYKTTDAVLEGDNLSSCSLCGHQMGTAARPIGGIDETTGQHICEQCRMQVDGDPDDAGAVLEKHEECAYDPEQPYWRKD